MLLLARGLGSGIQRCQACPERRLTQPKGPMGPPLEPLPFVGWILLLWVPLPIAVGGHTHILVLRGLCYLLPRGL